MLREATGRTINPDHPGSGAAFTAEGDLYVQESQEGLRATQAAG